MRGRKGTLCLLAWLRVIGYTVASVFSWPRFLGTLGFLGCGLALATIYFATQRTIFVEINGVRFSHRTHQQSAAGVLREMNILLHGQDMQEVPADSELRLGSPIRLKIARPVFILHDEVISQTRTQANTVGETLDSLGIALTDHDQVFMMGKLCPGDTPLPAPRAVQQANVRSMLSDLRQPVRLTIKRAVLLSVQDGSIPLDFYTTARTVGEALHERRLVIYAGDRVFPDVGTQVTPGLSVFIERSRPVVLDIGGDKQIVRTRYETVDELLRGEDIAVGPKDYVVPDLRTPIVRDLEVVLVRVFEEYHIDETPIPFQTRWESDETMEIDDRYTAHWGMEGAERRRFRVHYENGVMTYQTEEEEWIARRPVDRLIKYGTGIVLRSIDTPEGSTTYWRKLRMLATSYNAPTAGVPVTAGYYGRTRLGLRASKGIVAVDPQVIGLGQRVYVPDYGVALAGDTGGKIKGRRIDLCYDDDNLVLWYRWVDVYVLAPAPSTSNITWIIPDSPKEKG